MLKYTSHIRTEYLNTLPSTMSYTSINMNVEPNEQYISEAFVLAADEHHPDLVSDEDIEKMTERTLHDLPSGAENHEVLESMVRVASERIERDPVYKQVAANLFLVKYYDEVVEGIGEDLLGDAFVEYVEHAVELGLLDERMLTYDLERIAQAIDYERDQNFGYMALDTLHQRYFLKTEENGRRLELPQWFWMRVAMGLALNERVSERGKYAIQFYHMMSELRFVPSTPTLFHSGTRHPQLSSCYLTTVSDDLENIFDAYKEHAMLSKWSGGLGNDWTNLRSEGALINTTGVESTGTVPFLKISNDVTAAINRSGKRRGAACAYLECWHLDFEDFVDLRRNTGDERRRTHDMNTASWIPDLFMKRVREDGKWTLFSPDEVPGLHSTYGKEFEELYTEYEQQAQDGDLRQVKVVDASDLWRKMLTRLFETGHPWLTFKDPCNIRSPQDHAGVINSSNLCTEITLNTSDEETAVCNLGSVNLALHTKGNGLDRDMLAETVQVGSRMLDNVVDLCFYPTERARRSNLRHRPVGMGVMGFHDALIKQEIPFDSDEALEFADEAQEFVAYNAIMGSSLLAEERGAYESYEGSKWDRNIFPQDTLDLLEEERGEEIPVPRGGKLDWTDVREHVDRHGMRNSNVMATAPTATISTISGVSASIEPHYTNLYVKSNMSGEFTIVNDYLVDDLKEADLWDDEMLDLLKFHDGSVQEIDRVPQEIKDLYRGAFEIDPRHQMDMTARRGKWVDQSQSHNVFFPATSGKMLADVYMHSWEIGLKTTYYLRTLGASQIEKSTIDMEKYGKTQHRNSESSDSDSEKEEGQSCSLPAVKDDGCEVCQ